MKSCSRLAADAFTDASLTSANHCRKEQLALISPVVHELLLNADRRSPDSDFADAKSYLYAHQQFCFEPLCNLDDVCERSAEILPHQRKGVPDRRWRRWLHAPFNDLSLVDGDVGESATARNLIHSAKQRFGRIDVVINNAGIFVPKPFIEYTPEDFLRVVSTNLVGFFYVTQEAIRHMRQNGGGQILTITTTLAQQPVAGIKAALTNLTKGGLNSVTRALAIEYAAEGIRVNAIAPGIVDTPMHRPENHETLKRLHPIARLGTVQEIVNAALFLVRASFITGEVLYVDGGAHAGKWGPLQ